MSLIVVTSPSDLTLLQTLGSLTLQHDGGTLNAGFKRARVRSRALLRSTLLKRLAAQSFGPSAPQHSSWNRNESEVRFCMFFIPSEHKISCLRYYPVNNVMSFRRVCLLGPVNKFVKKPTICWTPSKVTVLVFNTLYSSCTVCFTVALMISFNFSLFVNAHAPAAISAVTTINKKQKNVTSRHFDSLNAPQQPKKATMTNTRPTTNTIDRPM